MPEAQIGVDIGGTFTDVVASSAGESVVLKVPSTPDDPGRAVLDGVAKAIDALGIEPSDVGSLVHATTVGTNALLERSGAQVGLLTTRGFGDMLEVGRLRRPDPYDLEGGRPRPLVPRKMVWEVPERVDADGSVAVALEDGPAREAVRSVVESGVEAVAISLLHSYREPAHERALAELIEDAAGGDIRIFASHEIVPEAREYERTSTTVIAAYLAPSVSRYVDRLREGLLEMGLPDSLWIMKSNGGLVTFGYAASHPEQLVESGPAAGVLAAAATARELGLEDVISFDMGGTTAKAALVSQGRPTLNLDYEVGGDVHAGGFLSRGTGYPLRSPVIDLAEVGTGGGSIAWVDAGGGLRLGPMSAGASPGPACYGRGGQKPTTTDADLVLGYIGEADFGEARRLKPELARAAMVSGVGSELEMEPVAVAESIFRMATTQMADAVRLISVAHGHDPRDFDLIAFGGSGPVHAWAIARDLGVARVVIPPFAGVNSAVGLLAAGFRADVSRGVRFSPRDDHAGELAGDAFRLLRDELELTIARQGLSLESVEFSASADLRYSGQSYELNVDVAVGPGLDSAVLAEVERSFHRAHAEVYGHSREDAAVELVVLRMSASTSPASPRLGGGNEASGPAEERIMHFDGAAHDCPVVGRDEVGSEPIAGPLAIRQEDTTTIVPPGASVRAEAGYLILDLEEGPGA